MTNAIVTVHMAASLDGYIARTNGAVDWLETSDHFDAGETLDPAYVEEFLSGIDCYVMGSKTYELACSFVEKGHGWVYGDKPTYVLTRRNLEAIRPTVEFHAGDLRALIDGSLRRRHRTIWVVGGGAVCGECIQQGLADELRYSIVPVVLGRGIPFFSGLLRDVPLHLKEVKAYQSGMVGLCYEIRRPG